MDIKAYIESGVIESCVLGMADAHEVAELQELSRKYPEVKQAINAFEASLEKAAFANTVSPRADVKEKLMISLKDEFAKSIPSPSTHQSVNTKDTFTETPVRNLSWIRYVAAASVVLFIVSAALNFYLYKKYDNAHSSYLALLKENTTITADNKVYQTKMLDIYNSMEIMSNPAMIKVAMPGVKGKENDLATVFWDSKTKDVYVLANNLPKPGDHKQYQLWALVDGKPVDAGMLDDCNGLCKLKNIPKAQAFAITLEKKGGSPVPDLTQLHVLGKVV